MQILFAVDTLEFLRRGGRIGGAQAWIGSTLRIKPILSIDSEILPVERVRTSGRAFEPARRSPRRCCASNGGDIFFIQHIRAPEQAARMAERGEEIFGRPPEFVSEIGPVIGAHVGPGLLGVTALPSRCSGPSDPAPPAAGRGRRRPTIGDRRRATAPARRADGARAGARRRVAKGAGMAATPTPPPPSSCRRVAVRPRRSSARCW